MSIIIHHAKVKEDAEASVVFRKHRTKATLWGNRACCSQLYHWSLRALLSLCARLFCLLLMYYLPNPIQFDYNLYNFFTSWVSVVRCFVGINTHFPPFYATHALTFSALRPRVSTKNWLMSVLLCNNRPTQPTANPRTSLSSPQTSCIACLFFNTKHLLFPAILRNFALAKKALNIC